MSVIFQAVITKMIQNLKRTCPKCKRDQIVPPSKNKKTVQCKFCGADISPAKQ